MISINDWWKQSPDNAQDRWLIVGKGPSFEKRNQFDLSSYRVISLNHVVREMQVEIAHIIDLDVVRDCSAAIEQNARFLLMPRRPHIAGRAQEKSLDALLQEYPVLKMFNDQKRLLVYELAAQRVAPSTSPWQPQPANPSFTVPLGTFSGEVVTTLLGMLGAKTVRTLGLDGGKNYANTFHDLNATRLDNGHASFDVQTWGIADAIQRYNMDYGALDTETPMRIFIGTDTTQLLGAKILEYSVRKHSTVTSVFDNMMHVQAPVPKDPKNQARTNFSFNRFAIPQLAGYRGRAVYVDADMQVFRDFRELWDTPFDGAKALFAPSSSPKRAAQLSVLLLDCNRLDWKLENIVRDLDEGRYDYDGLFKKFSLESEGALQASLPIEWNSLEEYHPGKTGLIHYTDMHVQPWVSRANQNGDQFVACLKSALRDGFISWAELNEAKSQKFVRPSLSWQLKLPRRVWPQFNKTFGRVLDRGFRPHEPLFTRLSQPN